MSGIPVYSQSPINASKASGITPQTAAPPAYPTAPTATTTTVPPTTTNSYPIAKPGAPAIPAPTGAASQRYAPVQLTPTTKLHNGPLPPQPGAVPRLSSPMGNNLPPPPKAGETFHPPRQASMPHLYPPQMAIPPPTNAYGAQPPTSSTSTTTAPTNSYPVLLSSNAEQPRRSLDHPPGYVQNPYASNFSADQRQAQEPNLGGYGGGSGAGTGSQSNGTTGAFGVDAESVWNTAKKWAYSAGEKLSETEAEIWKKVNGGK